jgi:Tol biopolymer transport system component
MAVRLAMATVAVASGLAVLVFSSAPRPSSTAVARRPAPVMLAFSARLRNGGAPQLFLLRTDGTASQATHVRGVVAALGWSPDGSQVLLSVRTSVTTSLDELSIATGSMHTLLSAPDIGPSAAWSPDGGPIAFEMRGDVIVSDGPGDLLRLSNRPPTPSAHVRETDTPLTQMSWSDAGTAIAFRMWLGNRSAVAVEQILPAGVARVLGPCGADRLCTGASQPTWAPGSNAVVFVRRSGGRSSLWWWTGGRPAPFPAGDVPSDVRAPAWSPDGHGLAFASSRGVFLVASPSAPARRLTATATIAGPVWSSDGSRIAFVARAGTGVPSQVWVMDLATGRATAYRSPTSRYKDVVGSPIWRPVAAPGT